MVKAPPAPAERPIAPEARTAVPSVPVAAPAPTADCYVVLGRHGDLINLFPIFRERAVELGDPVKLVVGKEFRTLFDSVTYVTPDCLDLTSDRIGQARNYAYAKYRNVRSLQVWGDGQRQSSVTPRYNMEAWQLAGMLHRFQDQNLRPILDVRNMAREDRLLQPHMGEKPIMVVSIEGGYSSPFRSAAKFKGPLLDAFRDSFRVVDLSTIQARSIQDLLGLMESAAVMVLADSAPLHLAAATNTPVVALLSDRGSWNMTMPRCNTLWTGDYNMALREVDRIIYAIKRLGCNPPTKPLPVLIHATEQHPEGLEERVRNRVARRSWWDWYRTKRVIAAQLNEPYARDGRSVGDKRKTPYLKEVLLKALGQSRPCDVIVWTNADTIVKPETTWLVWQAMTSTPVATQRRVDSVTKKPYWGRDLCAFRASWLREHWNEIPDFLLGTPEFDNWMALFARRLNNIDSTARELLYDRYPADIPAGSLEHIAHESYGIEPKRRYTAPENLYNLRLLRDWCRVHQPRVKFGSDGHVDWKV